jgi:hypothetical protein
VGCCAVLLVGAVAVRRRTIRGSLLLADGAAAAAAAAASPARGERGDGCWCEEKVAAADRTIASSCLHPSALRFDSLRAAEPVASLANP